MTGERRKIKGPISSPSGESAEEEEEGRRKYQCGFCSATHYLNNCPQFLALKDEQRGKFCVDNKICKMGNKCEVEGCNSSWHHTLLYDYWMERRCAKDEEEVNTMRTRAMALLDPT